MAPARKIQFPTREEWKRHKDEIVRLYVTEDMRLDEVRLRMEAEYNFRAKNRMYKTRFKSWGVIKYNPEAIMAALARNIENRKRRGKRTLIYKNQTPFNRAKIASHLKKKGMTMDQLLRRVPSDASIPAGFICMTPPLEPLDDAPASSTSASTPDQVGVTQTPPTSGVDTGLSSSEHIPTPQSTPKSAQEDAEAPALLTTVEAGPPTNVCPWTMGDPMDDVGLDVQTTRQGFENPAAYHFPQASTVDVSGETLFLSSPNDFPSNAVLDGNLHMSMSTCTEEPESYQPLRCSQAGATQQPWPIRSDPQPELFVAYCYLACILHGQDQQEGANSVASEAFKIYQTLIKTEHEQALACLNLVLAVLFMYGQSLFAVDLLKNAHQAALCHLHKESSIITTINFMVQQASRTVMHCGISPARLRVVYDDFKESRTLKHPYTLLAGYNLAWRLALDGADGFEQAQHLLSELQDAAEDTFGRAHMQTIAILTTKARILHDLKHRREAEELMSEAMDRIEMRYPANHPYALEAKRRHSIFLYAVNENFMAERRLVEVALGRVQVLGPENAFSKESVKDVESFLCAPGREVEFGAFMEDLAKAMAKSSFRSSTARTLQFW